jgi:hypothetical protein
MEDDRAPILGDLQKPIFTVRFSTSMHTELLKRGREGTRSRVKRISMFLETLF